MRGRRLLPSAAVVLAILVSAVPARAARVPLPNSMAATGDSLTRAFDSSWFGCVLVDCPQYSWSTGSSSIVDSQYLRILSVNPDIVGHAYNDAKSGSGMVALDGQLKTAAGQGVEYVTVFIGGADVCKPSLSTMIPTTVFTGYLRQALIDFFMADRTAHLYLSSMPNIFRLWSVLHTNPTAENKWTFFHTCQSMLSQSNTDAQRQQFVAQEEADNSVLATECARFVNAGFDCHWDNLAAFNFNLTAADFSTIDYFHPNRTGQHAIAALTWAAGYWPGL